MLVLAADAARGIADAERLGVHATLDRVDWPAIRNRIFGRLDPLHQSAITYRRTNGIDVYTEPARFVGLRVLDVGGERITATQIVVAAGARPVVPPIPGLDDVDFHTSDTIMRIGAIPTSLIIIGGGFIAAELGHVFDAFGSQVTIVARGPRLLTTEDEQVSARFTELAQRRFTVHLDSDATAASRCPEGVAVTVEREGRAQELRAEMLLVATGRRPNTDLLDVAAGGLDVDEHGHLVADTSYRTSVQGVWTLGDVANHFQPLLQAMMLGTTVDQLAHDVLYIHPALTEVVEQALLAL
jgi:mycothione reductase